MSSKTEYKNPLVSIAILDFKREKECKILFDSLEEYLKIDAKIVYCHDGPAPDYVLELFSKGKIDTLIYTKQNQGCGIQTRQLFQSCMTKYVIYVQVDQLLLYPLTPAILNTLINCLNDPTVFYVDLAGNQGQGNPSERALFIERERYLSITDIDKTIGGPGPYADHEWTEKRLQDYMKLNGLKFVTATSGGLPPFGNNGKWSIRSYECGGVTMHSTDEKVLYILKPLKKKYDFPNLKLSNQEWEEVLNGSWPIEGKIPEADKPHSFKVAAWN